MKAVNLIPEDLRGFSGAGGRSSTAVYALIGVLATLVVAASAWALTDRQIAGHQADLAQLQAEAQAAEARAAQLSPYVTFAKLSTERQGAVRALAGGRFDWATALREVSRLVPEGVYLTSMIGTTAPGVAVEGGAGNPLRSALTVPALEIVGCAPSQSEMDKLLPGLRAMDGVQRVSLSASEKGEASGGGGGGEGGDCRQGSDRIPQFNLVVFFRAPNAAGAAGPAGATAAAPAATGTAAPAAAPAAQPGTTTTPAPAATPTGTQDR